MPVNHSSYKDPWEGEGDGTDAQAVKEFESKTQQDKEWEKVFDEQFLPMPYCLAGETWDDEDVEEFNKARLRIKSFIHHQIQKARQEGYADGYKQGKFDAEITAEYGGPEALQDNK